MSLFKRSATTSKKADQPKESKSIYMSRDKIDRKGEIWRKHTFWFRKENLGKLKVLAHFEGVKIYQVIDRILQEYLEDNWDKSMAIKKLVAQSKPVERKVKI